MTQRNLAIVIGINAYENRISSLKTPVNDAIGVAEVLKSLYKYEVKQLLNSEATLEGLNNLLENLKAGTLTLSDGRTVQVTSYQRVLFYFAGHGITEDAFENKNGPAGYLLPQDAQKTDKSTFLPMRELHDVLVELECRHLLVILDCCFAGAFRFLRNLVPFQKLYRERYDRFMKGKAQQMIASAAYDEKALDVLTRLGLRENKNTRKHSPFAEVLLKALHGAADIIPDGVITASELYIYLEKELAEVTSRQTPGLYTLKHHEKGEYIFQIPGFVADNLEKAPPLNESTNPYRGLESFNEEHKDLFFGRERVINELYFYLYEFKCTAKELIFCTKLTSELFITWLSIIILRSHIKQPSLMIVNGASGTGKSSLVKAGLLPCLRDDGWYIVSPFRPGKSPFLALTQAILLTVVIREASVIKAKFSKNFNQSKYCCNLFIEVIVFIINIFAGILEEYNDQKIINSLSEVLQKNLKSLTKLAQISNIENSAKLLLVIDQFEELVTVCSEEEKEKFLTWLEKSVIENSETVRVIITLRSDFKAQFSKLFDVTRFIDVAQFTVPIMTQDEFREIIEKPATEKVLYFEPPELVDELINEVVQMPGALPLLSFTLSQLYLRCCDRWQEGEKNRTITLEDYKQLDGVMGSLKKTATDVFEKLIKEKKATEQTIRHVMLRMVSVSGDELARRRVLESELEYPEPKNGEAKEVIKAFTDARLLVKGTSDNGEPYVEPAHDALVNGWNQILVWKNQQQENLLLQRGLTPAVIEWERRKEEHSSKLTDLLEPLLGWFDGKFYQLGQIVNSFKKKERSEKENHHSRFLWHNNPRLDLLKGVLESDDNWLNQYDQEFVQRSILKRARNARLRFYSVTAVMISLVGFSGFIFIQGLDAKIQVMNIRSEELFNSHNELEALEKSLNTVSELKWLFGKWSWGISEETKIKTIAILQQIIYQIKEKNRLQGHTDDVNSVIFSPDGKILASASNDRTINLWNLEGSLVKTLKGHEGKVWSLDFNYDGTMLASIDEKGIVILWNMVDKTPRININYQGENRKRKRLIYKVKFIDDGKLLATAAGDKNIKIWRLDGSLYKELKGHNDTTKDVSYTANSKLLASASEDKTIKLWNIETGKNVHTFPKNKEVFTSVSFDAYGKLLAAASNDGIIKIWNTNNYTLKHCWKGHIYGIKHIGFNSDGKRLVSTSLDRTLKIWNLDNIDICQDDISEKQEEAEATFYHRRSVLSANFSPDSDSTLIASGSVDKTIRLWNIDGEKPEIIKGKNNLISNTSFSADGNILVALCICDIQNILELWNLKNKQYKIINYNNSDYLFYDVNLSQNGKKLAISMGEGDSNKHYIYLVDVESLFNQRNEKIEININKNQLIEENHLISDVSFSLNDKFLAYGFEKSNIIKLRRLDGGKPRIFRCHIQDVKSVSFSPVDSQLLVSGSNDGTVKLLGSGGECNILMQHNSDVDIVSFSSNGQLVASSDKDWTIKLRHRNKNTPLIFSGHRSNIRSIKFSQKLNSQLFVSGSSDKTVKLWSINDSIPLMNFTEHDSRVRDVSFSAEDKTLISISEDNTIVQRSMDLDNLFMRGCDWIKDYLEPNIKYRADKKNICGFTD